MNPTPSLAEENGVLREALTTLTNYRTTHPQWGFPDVQECARKALAAHPRKTDPVKGELEEALRKCRSALGQLAKGPVHYYLELADKALAACEAEKRSVEQPSPKNQKP